jgi:hypothetical protein
MAAMIEQWVLNGQLAQMIDSEQCRDGAAAAKAESAHLLTPFYCTCAHGTRMVPLDGSWLETVKADCRRGPF